MSWTFGAERWREAPTSLPPQIKFSEIQPLTFDLRRSGDFFSHFAFFFSIFKNIQDVFNNFRLVHPSPPILCLVSRLLVSVPWTPGSVDAADRNVWNDFRRADRRCRFWAEPGQQMCCYVCVGAGMSVFTSHKLFFISFIYCFIVSLQSEDRQKCCSTWSNLLLKLKHVFTSEIIYF